MPDLVKGGRMRSRSRKIRVTLTVVLSTSLVVLNFGSALGLGRPAGTTTSPVQLDVVRAVRTPVHAGLSGPLRDTKPLRQPPRVGGALPARPLPQPQAGPATPSLDPVLQGRAVKAASVAGPNSPTTGVTFDGMDAATLNGLGTIGFGLP